MWEAIKIGTKWYLHNTESGIAYRKPGKTNAQGEADRRNRQEAKAAADAAEIKAARDCRAKELRAMRRARDAAKAAANPVFI